MIQHTLRCVALAGIAWLLALNVWAADRNPAKAHANQPVPQYLRIPGTEHVVSLDAPKSKARGQPPSEVLVAALVTWISNNVQLPKSRTYPAVRLVGNAKIATFRYTGLLSDRPADVALVPPGQREVVAAYDPLANSIYLPDDWTGSTPAELSMLVHELVHHLQHVGHRHYDCPQASEEVAYEAQQKWLGLFGRSLESEFEIDPFTLLASVRCAY
jgi:hypothetical protein